MHLEKKKHTLEQNGLKKKLTIEIYEIFKSK